MSSPVALVAGSKFLLSLQVLLDLCGTGANPARAWGNQPILTARLKLSVITIALARDTVGNVSSVDTRARLNARLDALLATLRADGGAPIPLSENAATTWQSYMRESTLGTMAQVDRQFYATAFENGLCVVEYAHPYSAALIPLGLTVYDLGTRP